MTLDDRRLLWLDGIRIGTECPLLSVTDESLAGRGAIACAIRRDISGLMEASGMSTLETDDAGEALCSCSQRNGDIAWQGLICRTVVLFVFRLPSSVCVDENG